MPSLTDTAIRHALKRVELSQKQENLADGEGRGTGRLVLVLKPMPKRVTADWMAQQWRDGKRTYKKLGAYPSMSLAQAREMFKRDFADVIQRGRSIKIATDKRPQQRFIDISGTTPEPAPISRTGSSAGSGHRKWPPSGPRSSISSPVAAISWKNGETSPS